MLRLKKIHLRGKYKFIGSTIGYALAILNIAHLILLQMQGLEVGILLKTNILLVIVGLLLLKFKPYLPFEGADYD